MILKSPALRAIGLLTKRLTQRVSNDGGLHDPSKHITMNHFPHFIYVDYWPIGQYPQTYVLQSVASAAYQPQAEAILIETLNSKYNTQFKLADVLDQQINIFFRKIPNANPHKIPLEESTQFLTEILRLFATKIVVRESGWTWLKEQQVRANVAANLLIDYEYQTFRQFLQAYNQTIQQLVHISNYGVSSKVEHPERPQETHLYDQLNNKVTGIEDLNNKENPENNNFINKLMAVLHSI